MIKAQCPGGKKQKKSKKSSKCYKGQAIQCLFDYQFIKPKGNKVRYVQFGAHLVPNDLGYEES